MLSRKPHTKSWLKASLMLTAGAATLAMAPQALAQDAGDEVIVTGIRQTLENALIEKRQSDNLVEVILAEDIGKLPDQNLAEVLENITGVQITREEGIGTGVQIRGTDDNRIEINGVSTVGAGNGRGGVSFEDIDASIIAGLEVIKSPEASTTEGSVGGTVNLRTIRPLDLKGTLASATLKFEDSNLSSEGLQPRISGALGNKWENDKGQEIGVVLSGSYTKQNVTAFRPRLDRENVVICPEVGASDDCAAADAAAGEDVTHFLGVQFLNQVQRTQDFETINFAGSVEARPTPNLRLFADVIYNDQERQLNGSRVQVSTVNRVNGQLDESNGANVIFTDFETFDLGSARGPDGDQDLGSILAVTGGSFIPQQDGRAAPYLRVGSDAGSRLTETSTIRFGGEWEKDDLTVTAEYARAHSDTLNPNLSINLNFLNPNSFQLDGDAGSSDQNGTPVIFDLSDGFGFDINFGADFAPTEEQLLNADNYYVDGAPTYSADIRENTDEQLRLDISYDLADKGIGFISSVDAGYRYNDRSSLRDDRDSSTSSPSERDGSLNAGNILSLIGEIPDNFGEATGNALSVDGVLQVDPRLTLDQDAAIATINAAAAAQGIDPLFNSPGVFTSSESAFFDFEEETHAIYGQVNFDSSFNGIGFRGNAGLRYVDTTVTSNTGIATPVTSSNSYNFLLPRINLVVDATDDIVLRGSYTQDINRPDFTFNTPSRTFPDRNGVNDVSRLGSIELLPEEVESFDVSASWYFAPRGVFSVGYFRKNRTNLFGDAVQSPAGTGGIGVLTTGDVIQTDDGPFVLTSPNGRDISDPCEGGGIFSSNTNIGIFGVDGDNDRGVCVGDSTRVNVDGSTSQEGIEFALQYDLGDFEDRLGWASGFGLIANYTYQTEDTNTGFVPVGISLAQDIYDLQGFDRVTNPVQREVATLLNLSNNAYNITGYYEKYGLSARLRYTWRDEYATDDLPGTGNVFTPFDFRGTVESRGQLNGSLSYDLTDNLTFSVDAVNLTESDTSVSCVPDGGLPCYEIVADRRVIFGASYTF